MQIPGDTDAVFQKACLEIYRIQFVVKDCINIRFSLGKGDLILDAEDILLAGSGPGVGDIVKAFVQTLRYKSIHSGTHGIV